jgi:hypothetical protein
MQIWLSWHGVPTAAKLWTQAKLLVNLLVPLPVGPGKGGPPWQTHWLQVLALPVFMAAHCATACGEQAYIMALAGIAAENDSTPLNAMTNLAFMSAPYRVIAMRGETASSQGRKNIDRGSLPRGLYRNQLAQVVQSKDCTPAITPLTTMSRRHAGDFACATMTI